MGGLWQDMAKDEGCSNGAIASSRWLMGASGRGLGGVAVAHLLHGEG